MVPKLGSEKRPIIVDVTSEERMAEVASICKEHGWHYIIGFPKDEENLSDLDRALAALDRPKLKIRGAIPGKKKKRKRRRK